MTADPLTHKSIAHREFMNDVLRGLKMGAGRKHIDVKYLYDSAKPDMFDRVTHVPSYYPTNADIRTLEHHFREIAQALPDRCVACEIGGNSRGRTIPLLQECIDTGKISTFCQIDICDSTQSTGLEELHRELVLPKGSSVALQGICADMDSLDFALLKLPKPDAAFIFGVTALNCAPNNVPKRLRNWVQRFGNKIIFSAGTIVDDHTFLNAYNEPEAVHVEWFLGLLDRMNRELGANFNLQTDEKSNNPLDPCIYWAYDIELHEQKPWKFISMNLQSKKSQTVQFAGQSIAFEEGERIHIADTCRIAPQDMPGILAPQGLVVEHTWVDPQGQSAIYCVLV